MANVAVYNMEGKEVGSLELNDAIFGVEVNEHLVHMAVLQQLANNRQGTQKAKTRSEVSGGGRKPWRQKGTGHARQGSIRAPQWKGGGVVFAPTPRDYSFKMNKKEKAAAIKSALTTKVNEGKLVVVEGMEFDAPKTKTITTLLNGLDKKKALIVVAEEGKNATLSVRNIPTARGVFANSINVYDILKYDNVMNDQRKVIYEQRKELMAADDVSETIREMRQEYLADTVSAYLPHGSAPNEWQKEELKQELYRITGFMLPITNWANEPEIDADKMQEKILDEVENRIAEKNANVPENIVRMVEKNVLMQVLDQLWKEHIASLDLMRHTIVLRAYGQKDPLNEYKKEAFNMFSVMLDNLREKVTFLICRTVIQTDALDALMIQENRAQNMQEIHETPESLVGRPSAPNNYESDEKNEPFQYSRAEFDPKDPRTWGKVARNDLCPCGSGKKYKHCHGKI